MRHALIALPALAIACGGAAAEPPPAMPEPAPMAEPAPEPAPEPEPEAPAPPPKSEPVEITIDAKSGSKLKGTARFEETDDGVKVTITVEGITPGMHGSHVHETGDCSAKDGSSAGGHFNPASHDHGLPGSDKRHLGDLGNIEIGKDGKGSHEILAQGANLRADDPNSFLGRAIIIHEKKDDGGQPTGNAGGRIGCGVIKR